MVIGFVAIIAPFQARNFSKYGHYTLSTISGNVLFDTAVRVKAEKKGIDFIEARDELGWQEWVDYENPFERSAASKSPGIEYILENPVPWVLSYVEGMLYFVANTEKTQYLYDLFERELPYSNTYLEETITGRIKRIIKNLPNELFLTPVMGAKLFIEYLAFALGIFLLTRKNQKTVGLFLLLTLFYFIVTTGQLGGTPRYKIPVIPIFAIVGGGGATLIWAYVRNWKLPRNRLTR